MDDFVLAGDLGGTNLRLAAVDVTGRLLFRVQAETPRDKNEAAIVGLVAELAEKCCNEFDREPLAFGFAIPAIIGPGGRDIYSSPNLPELNGICLGSAIEARLGMAVTIENDANAAAIGENWLGASRGSRSSVCITLGTGVGGGIILDGGPYRGLDGTAGEIGHTCVELLGPDCGCGSNGCLEQYASASAIVRMASELLNDLPDSTLSGIGDFSALDVFQLGVEGDVLCNEVFKRVGKYLGISLSALINVFNPEVIVIGGGAAAGWDLFIGHVHNEIKLRAFQQPAERAKIVRAELEGDSGIIGAANLAFASRDGSR